MATPAVSAKIGEKLGRSLWGPCWGGAGGRGRSCWLQRAVTAGLGRSANLGEVNPAVGNEGSEQVGVKPRAGGWPKPWPCWGGGRGDAGHIQEAVLGRGVGVREPVTGTSRHAQAPCAGPAAVASCGLTAGVPAPGGRASAAASALKSGRPEPQPARQTPSRARQPSRLAGLRAAKTGQTLGPWGRRRQDPALSRPCVRRWTRPRHPRASHGRPEARGLGLDPAAVWDRDLWTAMECDGEKGAT